MPEWGKGGVRGTYGGGGGTMHPLPHPLPNTWCAPPQVSVLSYGAWVSFGYQFGVPEAKELISKCFDAGVNL